MARTLEVYLHSDLIGHLIQGDGGDMVFDYVESWLNKPGATPLSQSFPLRKKRSSAMNAGASSPAFCRKGPHARSSPAISASAHRTTMQCWSGSAANARVRSLSFRQA